MNTCVNCKHSHEKSVFEDCQKCIAEDTPDKRFPRWVDGDKRKAVSGKD